jgi:hypothetical protein
MFRVDYDPRLNLMWISVKGFWTLDTVPMLATAIGTKVQEIRARRDDFDVIVESLDFPVQANDVADSLSNIMAAGMTLTSGRAAIVVGSILNRLQVERTLVHPRLSAFPSLEAALAWLGKA